MNAPDYEGARLALKRRRVLEGTDVSDDRIRSYCMDGGYDESEVREKIKNDEMFRWLFVKDPIRQNVHESLFLKFVGRMAGVHDAQKITGVRLYEGKILTGGEVKHLGVEPPCKRINLHWEYKGCRFYAYHKYAGDTGGHQDNQYHNLKCFITEANKVGESKTVFLAIADGEFWNTINGRAGMAKIEKLKSMANKRSVFALSSGELAGLLDSVTREK